MARSRSESLEFALLGLLSQDPLHGYELRKRLRTIFGPFRALSFSVLYPQLRRMTETGLVEQESVPKGGRSKRTRLVYSITDALVALFENKFRLQRLLADEPELTLNPILAG